jgi:hypothetical protein
LAAFQRRPTSSADMKKGMAGAISFLGQAKRLF